jgi:asparagine synthase (glutamine-hydrolysing)
MCGINGIVDFNGRDSKDLPMKVSLMQQAIKHRGPDDSEVVAFQKAAFGMNRLAIVAPEVRSTVQSTRDHILFAVFNGEIVNHIDLRKCLKNAPGIDLGDSAVILPLFEELGENYVEKLAGMFAIAIYDRLNNKLQLWRDPLGIKPLYYSHSNGRVVFSSETKAVYAVADQVPEADFSALDDCLKYRFHPGRETVFPGIQRVLPGETITFADEKESHRQYWMLRPNDKTSEVREEKRVDEFRKLLMRVVQENTKADVKGGYFVSGGLDSSLITAIGLQNDSTYQQAISLKFSPNPVEDEPYAEFLEKHLGTTFEWVDVSDETARKTLEEAVAFMDEPLENPIHIGTYLLSKRAQELGIKSVLTGDGSDEFFIGYNRHQPWFQKGANPTIEYPQRLWTLSPTEANELYTDEAKSKVRPMLNYSGEPVEPFTNVDQALHFERFDRLTEYHCNRLDRMTMARGVEARVPFLDRRIVDLALQIPLPELSVLRENNSYRL